MAISKGPRVLWASNETPDLHGQGGQRRQYFQLRELVRAGADVSVFSLAGPQSDASLAGIAGVRRHRTPLGRFMPAAIRSARLEKALNAADFDAIVISHTESWGLVRDSVRRGRRLPRTLVDLHNVYTGRTEFGEHGAQMAAWETEILETVDAVAVCSETELARLGSQGTARRLVLPHGVDLDEFPDVPRDVGPPAVGAIGNWDWEPNARGIRWFIEEVWPAVRKAMPTAEALIAGRGLHPSLQSTEGVHYLGRIPSHHDLIARVDAMVVPVRNSIGAPVKYAEALATGRSVAATSDAAAAHPGAPAFVSDDPTAWATHLLDTLGDSASPGTAPPERRYALRSLSWSRTSLALVDWALER